MRAGPPRAPRCAARPANCRHGSPVKRRPTFLICCLLGSLAGAACTRGKPLPRTEDKPSAVALKRMSDPDRGENAKQARHAKSPVGTNLDSLEDWSEDWVSVDAFKRSRDWISGTKRTFDDGRPLALDEHGWVRSLAPGQVARTLMFWGEVKYPSGDYLILYEGKGTLTPWPQEHVVTSRPGRMVLRVDSKKGGIGLVIEATDPTDPIRNIRVLMPGGVCSDDPRRACDRKTPCGKGARCAPFEENYATQIFHPHFLSRVSHYGALRFMDWMRTNGSKIARWEERPKPDDARWSKGAPLEVMVELANRLDQDPWFTLPHTATDGYVASFARYVHEHLEPGRRPHVEHSNEVWNDQFPQAKYARERGQAGGLGGTPFEAQLAYHARRTAEIAKIWERVYGTRKGELVRVLGAQAANPWTSEVMLAFEDVRAHVDALAIAPYFGGYLGAPEEQARVEKLSLDQLFAELRQRALPEVEQWIRKQIEVARKHRVQLIAYEGGQHLTGVGPAVDNAALNALFDAANRDPRMGALYFDYLTTWRKLGGALFVHFTDCSGFSRWGRWGALEWLEQPRSKAPKFDAIARFIEQNGRWW